MGVGLWLVFFIVFVLFAVVVAGDRLAIGYESVVEGRRVLLRAFFSEWRLLVKSGQQSFIPFVFG